MILMRQLSAIHEIPLRVCSLCARSCRRVWDHRGAANLPELHGKLQMLMVSACAHTCTHLSRRRRRRRRRSSVRAGVA
jgi:hypothetical protein